MLETTVEVLRAPVAVLGVGGVLIAVGIILSDRRRYYSGGAANPNQRRHEEPSQAHEGAEDER